MEPSWTELYAEPSGQRDKRDSVTRETQGFGAKRMRFDPRKIQSIQRTTHQSLIDWTFEIRNW